jgi:hypothetical protein
VDNPFQSIHSIQDRLHKAGILYKLISTRRRDHDDVIGVVRRQGKALDKSYILDWLRQFEQALDESTLVKEFLALWGMV